MAKRYWENSDFWKDAGEKVVTSFFQGVIGLLVIDGATGPTIDLTSWKTVLLSGCTLAFISAGKSIIGSKIAPNSTTPTGLL